MPYLLPKIGISAGLALSIGAYLWMMIRYFQKRRNRFGSSGIKRALNNNRRIGHIARFARLKFKFLLDLSKKQKIIIAVTTALFVSTSRSLGVVHINLVLGAMLGLIGVKAVEKAILEIGKTQRLKETAILFEAIELYTRAGYSLVQALKASKMLTKSIRPSIDKALAHWGQSPQKALTILKEELQSEDAESIVMLLMHMEKNGSKNLNGIIRREANNIERIQRMRTEAKVSKRPLILVVYKVLPLFSVLCIVVGSLLYRMFNIFMDMGLM